ncbi:MAG: bifunctional glutamate N-acetyltransferase/amino-acid acetyltransferase ArgJ [Thermodesulfobacteriota bacterium]|nr:bifunctional glutamate N-acetyltransferase/amino-acid acetyltransferase ArgJ [Thermodesulfobacteriota bacterium]
MIKVEGFKFSGISCGLKKSNKKDLGLILSEKECLSHAVFTRNKVIAAPLEIGKKIVKIDKIHGVIVNSGNANSCTGTKGIVATKKILEELAKKTDLHVDNFFPSSTGIIGVQLDYKKINKNMDKLLTSLNASSYRKFAESIQTTDKFIKFQHSKIKLGNSSGNLLGIAKGAGMIHPGMATMLCFFVTDLKFNKSTFKSLIDEAIATSFNCISVDGDMSTNDTVIALSNGMAGNKSINNKSQYLNKVKREIQNIFYELAKLIVKDGEGATKVCEIVVKGAKSKVSADTIARKVANSLLFKTALYGSDPNWGRIIASVGATEINYIKQDKIDIYVEKIKIVRDGQSNQNITLAKKLMKKKEVKITIDLNIGGHSAFMLTNDIGHDYINLNSLYTT